MNQEDEEEVTREDTINKIHTGSETERDINQFSKNHHEMKRKYRHFQDSRRGHSRNDEGDDLEYRRRDKRRYVWREEKRGVRNREREASEFNSSRRKRNPIEGFKLDFFLYCLDGDVLFAG